MKILTVTHSLKKGGVARTAQNFAEGYQALGLDSRVLVANMGDLREEILRAKNIPCWSGITQEALDKILHWNPEIIHIHSHSFSDSEMALLRKLFVGRTVVEKNVFSRPVRWTHEMDYSYQLSHWCAWRFCNSAPHLTNKAAIVPNSADPSAFANVPRSEAIAFRQQHNIPEKALVIGRIGQHYDVKWSPILIDSFNRLSQKHPDLYLLLINPSKAVREQAEASPFTTQIVIIDKIIGDHNLSIAYSATDVFALAADQGESFGNVLAEAMLCEVPVVALSTPWQDNSQCEVVGHNIGGLIALTPKGFCRAIDTLLQNKPLREKMGRAGRQSIIDRFDRRRVAQISLDAIHGKHPPLDRKVLDRQILEIYSDAFEKASSLTLWLLKDKRFLRLTRCTTHYESIWKLPLKIAQIIASKLFSKPWNRLRRISGLRRAQAAPLSKPWKNS